MEILRTMYIHFCSSSQYDPHMELTKSGKILATESEINSFIQSLGKDKYAACEELINAYAGEREQQGFILGFRFAMKLMSECQF